MTHSSQPNSTPPKARRITADNSGPGEEDGIWAKGHEKRFASTPPSSETGEATGMSPEVRAIWERGLANEEKYGCEVNAARVIGFSKPATPTTDEAIAREAAEEICDIEGICIGGNYSDPTARAVKPEYIAAIILRALQRARQGTEKGWEDTRRLDWLNAHWWCGDKQLPSPMISVRAAIDAARSTKEGGK